MKLWFRRIFVFLVAVMTFGLYIPSAEPDAKVNDEKNILSPNKTLEENDDSSADPIVGNEHRFHDPEEKESKTALLAKQAREQTITKLGPRILEQVEDDFMEVILPTMEEVLTSLLVEAGPQEVPYFMITDQPADGYGEKIFHVYDVRNDMDIARFHVRRDKRPTEGYWFNFHYHLSKDHFEKHHEIGEIYWSKDDPPKWMA